MELRKQYRTAPKQWNFGSNIEQLQKCTTKVKQSHPGDTITLLNKAFATTLDTSFNEVNDVTKPP